MKKLSEKALAFCQEYIKNGCKGTDAYVLVYWREDRLSAAVSAHELLKDQRVKDEIASIEWDFRNIGIWIGLDKKAMVDVLAGMVKAERVVARLKDEKGNITEVKAPDWKTRYDGVMGFAKLTGDLTEKKKIEIDVPEEEWDIDLSKLKWEDLKEARKKIIENMTVIK